MPAFECIQSIVHQRLRRGGEWEGELVALRTRASEKGQIGPFRGFRREKCVANGGSREAFIHALQDGFSGSTSQTKGHCESGCAPSKMGSAYSSNAAYLMEGISINSSASCNARLYQDQNANHFVAKSVECGGDFNFGNQIAQQVVNCRNDQQVAASARAAATQLATSSVSGLAAIGQAQSNNVVDMQENIAMSIQGRCDASIQQSIHNESYKSGDIVAKGACNIFSQKADQRFTCTNSIIASASETESATQKATATVTGLSFADLIILLVVILLLVLVPFGMIVKALTGLIKGVGDGIGSIVSSVGKSIGNVFGGIGNAFGELLNPTTKAVASVAPQALPITNA